MEVSQQQEQKQQARPVDDTNDLSLSYDEGLKEKLLVCAMYNQQVQVARNSVVERNSVTQTIVPALRLSSISSPDDVSPEKNKSTNKAFRKSQSKQYNIDSDLGYSSDSSAKSSFSGNNQNFFNIAHHRLKVDRMVDLQYQNYIKWFAQDKNLIDQTYLQQDFSDEKQLDKNSWETANFAQGRSADLPEPRIVSNWAQCNKLSEIQAPGLLIKGIAIKTNQSFNLRSLGQSITITGRLIGSSSLWIQTRSTPGVSQLQQDKPLICIRKMLDTKRVFATMGQISRPENKKPQNHLEKQHSQNSNRLVNGIINNNSMAQDNNSPNQDRQRDSHEEIPFLLSDQDQGGERNYRSNSSRNTSFLVFKTQEITQFRYDLESDSFKSVDQSLTTTPSSARLNQSLTQLDAVDFKIRVYDNGDNKVTLSFFEDYDKTIDMKCGLYLPVMPHMNGPKKFENDANAQCQSDLSNVIIAGSGSSPSYIKQLEIKQVMRQEMGNDRRKYGQDGYSGIMTQHYNSGRGRDRCCGSGSGPVMGDRHQRDCCNLF